MIQQKPDKPNYIKYHLCGIYLCLIFSSVLYFLLSLIKVFEQQSEVQVVSILRPIKDLDESLKNLLLSRPGEDAVGNVVENNQNWHVRQKNLESLTRKNLNLLSSVEILETEAPSVLDVFEEFNNQTKDLKAEISRLQKLADERDLIRTNKSISIDDKIRQINLINTKIDQFYEGDENLQGLREFEQEELTASPVTESTKFETTEKHVITLDPTEASFVVDTDEKNLKFVNVKSEGKQQNYKKVNEIKFSLQDIEKRKSDDTGSLDLVGERPRFEKLVQEPEENGSKNFNIKQVRKITDFKRKLPEGGKNLRNECLIDGIMHDGKWLVHEEEEVVEPPSYWGKVDQVLISIK